MTSKLSIRIENQRITYTGMNTLSKSTLVTRQRRAEVMLPDEMEAEKNRKMILAQADEIEILKQNVRDLQESLQHAHIRIKKLTEEQCNPKN